MKLDRILGDYYRMIKLNSKHCNTNKPASYFLSQAHFQFVFTHVKQKTLHFRYYCQRKLAWERKPAWEQAADKYFPIHLPSQPCRWSPKYFPHHILKICLNLEAKQLLLSLSNHTHVIIILHVRWCTGSTVLWTYLAMAVIIHHIYPSEFKSLSHMLKHSPLAEPRMQHTDDQVAHRRASSWTEALGVLIVCMDMADIVVHPSWPNQLSIHPFSGSWPSQLQKKKQNTIFPSHSCITWI